MNVALVYDRVNKFGGAERVLLALHKIWPQAPLYTSVYDKENAPWAKDFQVIPSFLQKIPLIKKNHELFPWLMPFAFESFNFDKFDVVISVTSAEAKAIMTKPKTLHLCYCLTPTRYLWSSYKHYLSWPRLGLLNPLVRIIMKPSLGFLRKWDLILAQRPDNYVAISKTVQARIKKYYKREAEVIYPPINIQNFKPKKVKEATKPYFLVVSRLVSYKRIDIIIKAFNKLGLPLKIIGDGRQRKKLERLAKKNIEFLGQNLTETKLLSYYQNCLALIFIAKEDFGLVSLEAQACGKPVIAYTKGGLGETVINGKTGILFSSQTSKSLENAIKKFKKEQYSAKKCRNNAEKFKEQLFIKKFKNLVEDKWQKLKKTTPK